MHQLELLDGAMGSEFIKRGNPLPSSIWSAQINLDGQELVQSIHKEYIDAGADYITTNTFRTTQRSYTKTGLSIEDAKLLSKIALESSVKIAKRAAQGEIKVLGSIAPLEDCYKPELFPGIDIAKKEFYDIATWFNNTKIDIYLLETMNSIIETKTCLDAVSKFDKPIWVSFILKDNKHILSGESLNDSINMLQDYDVDCLLVNCSPLKRTNDSLTIISNKWSKKWGIYPNLGIGEPATDGNIPNTHSDEEFLSVSRNAISAGASILGGCCGSSPYHISLLKNNLF